MIEDLEDIKYFSLVSYMDFLKIKREISKSLNDRKALVFIMSENFLEESISSQNKHEILKWLCCLETIAIVVIDCNISDKSIEYLLCFDLCLATTRSVIAINTLMNTEYFLCNHIRLLSGNQYDLCQDGTCDIGYSVDLALVNKRIDFENIEFSVSEFLAPILEGKSHDYIRFLKKYFNLYKENKGINRSLLQSEETISFCELALKKYENG